MCIRDSIESVASDEFVDDMINRGCRFSWNFTYMPVGKQAQPDYMVTPEERAYMYRRIREIRETKPIFAMDFWNDGEYAHGSVSYTHLTPSAFRYLAMWRSLPARRSAEPSP